MYRELLDIFGSDGCRKDVHLVRAYLEERNGKRGISISETMQVFLIFFSKYSSLNLFKEVCMLVVCILRFSDEYGRQIERNLSIREKKIANNLRYSHHAGPALLPELFMAYMHESFSQEIPAVAEWLSHKCCVYPNLFGVVKINLIRTLTFLDLIVSWLTYHAFTPTILEIRNLPKVEAPYLQNK